MAVQQASLFFDNPPEEIREQTPLPALEKIPTATVNQEETSKELVIQIEPPLTPAIEPERIIVDDVVREIDLEPVTFKGTTERPAKKSGRGRMRLSDMDLMADLVEVPEDDVLFQKSYYGISDVSKMFKVNISLIRFWENAFDILKPKKNGKGDRLFRPEDIKNLQLIYHLLREKKYTIDGAKDFLKKNKKVDETFELIESLKKTKAFLLDLKANL